MDFFQHSTVQGSQGREIHFGKKRRNFLKFLNQIPFNVGPFGYRCHQVCLGLDAVAVRWGSVLFF